MSVVIEVMGEADTNALAAALPPDMFEFECTQAAPQDWYTFTINRTAWPRASAVLAQRFAVYIMKEYP